MEDAVRVNWMVRLNFVIVPTKSGAYAPLSENSILVEISGQILRCKCCGASSNYIGSVDFNKSCADRLGTRIFPKSDILVPYWKCADCGFIFTNHADQWTDQDFQRLIYNDDYAKADPPIPGRQNVPLRETPSYQKGKLIASLFQGSQNDIRILDYGAGGNPGPTGLALIDEGFNVRSYEPHRAKGADADQIPEGRYHLIIAVEVFEHCHRLRDLAEFMDNHLCQDGLIWIQTLLHPHPAPADILNSWYISPRNGHVSIFTFWALTILFSSVRLNIVQTVNGIFGFRNLPQFRNKIFFS